MRFHSSLLFTGIRNFQLHYRKRVWVALRKIRIANHSLNFVQCLILILQGPTFCLFGLFWSIGLNVGLSAKREAAEFAEEPSVRFRAPSRSPPPQLCFWIVANTDTNRPAFRREAGGLGSTFLNAGLFYAFKKMRWFGCIHYACLYNLAKLLILFLHLFQRDSDDSSGV